MRPPARCIARRQIHSPVLRHQAKTFPDASFVFNTRALLPWLRSRLYQTESQVLGRISDLADCDRALQCWIVNRDFEIASAKRILRGRRFAVLDITDVRDVHAFLRELAWVLPSHLNVSSAGRRLLKRHASSTALAARHPACRGSPGYVRTCVRWLQAANHSSSRGGSSDASNRRDVVREHVALLLRRLHANPEALQQSGVDYDAPAMRGAYPSCLTGRELTAAANLCVRHVERSEHVHHFSNVKGKHRRIYSRSREVGETGREFTRSCLRGSSGTAR